MVGFSHSLLNSTNWSFFSKLTEQSIPLVFPTACSQRWKSTAHWWAVEFAFGGPPSQSPACPAPGSRHRWRSVSVLAHTQPHAGTCGRKEVRSSPESSNQPTVNWTALAVKSPRTCAWLWQKKRWGEEGDRWTGRQRRQRQRCRRTETDSWVERKRQAQSNR